MDAATTCPACGESDLFWTHTFRVPEGLTQGRLHTNDLTVVVCLGCSSCGTTIETMELDEFLGGVQPERRLS